MSRGQGTLWQDVGSQGIGKSISYSFAGCIFTQFPPWAYFVLCLHLSSTHYPCFKHP
jgi:hypothetical protein